MHDYVVFVLNCTKQELLEGLVYQSVLSEEFCLQFMLVDSLFDLRSCYTQNRGHSWSWIHRLYEIQSYIVRLKQSDEGYHDLKMDAAFTFSCTWRSLMVSYDGRPMIDSMVGRGKPALILLIFIVGILFLTISYDYY